MNKTENHSSPLLPYSEVALYRASFTLCVKNETQVNGMSKREYCVFADEDGKIIPLQAIECECHRERQICV